MLPPPTKSGDWATEWSWRDSLIVAALMLGVLAVYLRTAGYGFVNYDDAEYVYDNAHVRGGLTPANVRWAMTAVVSSNWHPLTLLAELAITSAFGPGPGGFHAASAGLHAVNASLLFLFLRRATGQRGPAGFAAAIWAWHPLRVESVAWVSELKDVLCGTFSLLTLVAYAGYARARTGRRYASVAVPLALAMLAKPMAVMVPAVLLLLDYWPLCRSAPPPDGRWWRARVVEKLPLAAVTVAVAALALATQARTAAGSLSAFPPGERAANAAVATVTYLRQAVWPSGLAAFYPHPAMLGRRTPAAAVAAAAVVLAAVTATVVALSRPMPYLPVGWLWFAVMLLPVIGLVQVGQQAHADRYTYLPSIGLTVAVVWAAAGAAAARPARGVLAVVGFAAAASALAVAAADVRHWRDTRTLFTWADAVVPDNYEAMVQESACLLRDGQVGPAARLAARAADLVGPRAAGPHAMHGLCLLASGRDADVQLALHEFVTTVRIRPIDAGAWAGIGQALGRRADWFTARNRTGDAERCAGEAADAYRRALRLAPDNPEVADRLAALLAAHGDRAGAAASQRSLLGTRPNGAPAASTAGVSPPPAAGPAAIDLPPPPP